MPPRNCSWAVPRDVRTTTSPPRPPADPVAVLAAVAVDPARRGRGIGAELTAGFEAAATQFGTPTAELATHVDTADSASSTSHGFYERLDGPRRAPTSIVTVDECRSTGDHSASQHRTERN